MDSLSPQMTKGELSACPSLSASAHWSPPPECVPWVDPACAEAIDSLLPFRPPRKVCGAAVQWQDPLVTSSAACAPPSDSAPQVPEGHQHSELLHILRWIAEEGDKFLDLRPCVGSASEFALLSFDAVVGSDNPTYFTMLAGFIKSKPVADSFLVSERFTTPSWVRASGVPSLWRGTVVDGRDDVKAHGLVFSMVLAGVLAASRVCASSRGAGDSVPSKAVRGSCFGVVADVVRIASRAGWDGVDAPLQDATCSRPHQLRRTILHFHLSQAICYLPIRVMTVATIVYVLRTIEGCVQRIRGACARATSDQCEEAAPALGESCDHLNDSQDGFSIAAALTDRPRRRRRWLDVESEQHNRPFAAISVKSVEDFVLGDGTCVSLWHGCLTSCCKAVARLGKATAVDEGFVGAARVTYSALGWLLHEVSGCNLRPLKNAVRLLLAASDLGLEGEEEVTGVASLGHCPSDVSVSGLGSVLVRTNATEEQVIRVLRVCVERRRFADARSVADAGAVKWQWQTPGPLEHHTASMSRIQSAARRWSSRALSSVVLCAPWLLSKEAPDSGIAKACASVALRADSCQQPYLLHVWVVASAVTPCGGVPFDCEPAAAVIRRAEEGGENSVVMAAAAGLVAEVWPECIPDTRIAPAVRSAGRHLVTARLSPLPKAGYAVRAAAARSLPAVLRGSAHVSAVAEAAATLPTRDLHCFLPSLRGQVYACAEA